MMQEYDLSMITGLEGYDSHYSLPEFTDYLKAGLSSEESEDGGCVFWRATRYQQSNYELLSSDFNPSSTSYKAEIQIISMLKDIASEPAGLGCNFLAQFWAARVDGDEQRHFLTTTDQPFCVGSLCKGLCWYRKLCMDHYCLMEDEAGEEQLGAIGRVYRNKHPESSPDLRLYSINEFPLRDFAARCGLRRYLAMPVFDLFKNECYGVLELLSFHAPIMDHIHEYYVLDHALQVVELRSTHIQLSPISDDGEQMPPKYKEQPEKEISKMLELAIKAIPQLHLAQVWVPCKQCAKMGSNSCMERSTFINFDDEIVNSCKNVDPNMFEYLQACEFHNLQKEKGIPRALMSSSGESCFYQNLCDMSISENPLVHYAQKARLSLCFALCLGGLHNNNDLYVIEFFLQSKCREDACGDSLVHSILRLMEMELKSYKFALGETLREESLVKLCQPNAIQYQSIEHAQEMNHQTSELNFLRYLQTNDLCCLRPSEKNQHAWVFCSLAGEQLSENDINSNSSLVPNPIKKKIELLMKGIASKLLWDPYSLVQFWAPEMKEDRCYLTTSEQPYALGSLAKGLALFRKQCIHHHYYVDEGTSQGELGPPGRVFRNKHPEITRDLRLYSTREFSLKNHAEHCCLRKYFALPVFDSHQHKCVGVLELVEFSYYNLGLIGEALKEANLSSAHINFKPSFLASRLPANITECRKLALAEIEEALLLINKISQLYVAEVWVPYSECGSMNSNLCCMELALSTATRWESGFSIQIHVESRKGIAGMVLASENKSCFCRNSCDFSITEQPLAHYEQRERQDVCFAIGLQCSYTGNLHYILEFFLNQGPAKHEYLWSFLNFLLPILKHKLINFKVASGKPLGEEMVVEVIEFSETDELIFSELDQPDIFPLKFKTVQYGQKEHQHTKDQQLQYVSDAKDSVRNVAETKACSTTADNFKKEDATKKTEKGKGKTGLRLKLEDLKPHFGKRLKDVAEDIGVGRSTIKRACRYYGIHRWPCNEKHKKNPSLFETKSANDFAPDSQQNICSSDSGNSLPSDMPLQQNVPQTNTKSTQHLTVKSAAENVTVMVKYEGDTIKFQLCLSSGLDKLLEVVSMRLNLKKESLKLKYVDEDNDEILLACDVDFQLCLKSVTAIGQPCIQLFVQLIHK